MRRNLAAVFTLVALTPLVAEFLLGDQWLSPDHGVGTQLGMFLGLAPWYGGGALLIRELTRRTGRGWPTILLLGLAFGLVEEGLLTQSLFNPHYLGLDLLSYGHVAWLGTGLPWALFVLTLHVVWSIATPIAVTEGIWPAREPWTGRVGLTVTAVLMALGAVVIFGFSWASSAFLAAPGQLVGAALLAAVAAVVAFRLPRVDSPRPAGRLLPAAVLATVLASGFQLIQHDGPSRLPAGLTSGLMMIVLAGAVTASIRWRLDVLGLAVGPVLTYAWVGLANAVGQGGAAVTEQLVIIAVTLVVTALALRRHHRDRLRSGSGAGAAATAASHPA